MPKGPRGFGKPNQPKAQNHQEGNRVKTARSGKNSTNREVKVPVCGSGCRPQAAFQKGRATNTNRLIASILSKICQICFARVRRLLYIYGGLSDGVTVAHSPLEAIVLVRIQVGQPIPIPPVVCQSGSDWLKNNKFGPSPLLHEVGTNRANPHSAAGSHARRSLWKPKPTAPNWLPGWAKDDWVKRSSQQGEPGGPGRPPKHGARAPDPIESCQKWTPNFGPVTKLDFSGSAGCERSAEP